MEKSVTLDRPGTGKRCTLKERPYASTFRARADGGDSDVWSDDVVALGVGGRWEVGGEEGGE